MKVSTLTGFGLAAALAVACSSPPPQTEAAPESSPPADATPPGFTEYGAHPCDPVDDIQFICDMISPEDLAVLPGAEWVIASGAQEGGRLQLINAADKTTTVLFPKPGQAERLDALAYPTCPGPLAAEEQAIFRGHGLYLKPGAGAVHTLYVVHHGTRESIEVFDVSADGGAPELTWVGCVPALSTLSLNSVVALPDGGLASTSGPTDDVWAWHTSTGWTRIPGSEGTAPNGLEISGDGRWLYIAGWSQEKMTRISLGASPVQQEVIDLGFRPDNLRMALDGSVLFASGHTDKDGLSITDPREPLRETINVAAIDPETLEFTRIFEHPAMDGFVTATTAMRIGDEMWLGSYRGDRIAYFPAPD
ncbi:MAG: hypothetical protein O3A25_16735 [Acidobacteria bacterium]|nr:hypothetical protein [Acidobacteriota bacterium]